MEYIMCVCDMFIESLSEHDYSIFKSQKEIHTICQVLIERNCLLKILSILYDDFKMQIMD